MVEPPTAENAFSGAALHSLDRSLLRGVAWSGGLKWTSQVLSWATTIAVARLLTPSDFGLVGMAGVLLGIVALLNEFGLGTAVLTLRGLSPVQIAQLNGLSVLLGILSFLACWTAAPPVSGFFGAPELVGIVRVAGGMFVILAFQTIPQALLRRERRFRQVALIDATQALLASGAMVLFALLGLRYWTMVYGTILGAACSTLMCVALARERFSWPRPSVLGEVLTMSRRLIVERLAWFGITQSDSAVTGRFLGKNVLGLYSLASSIATGPVEKVTSVFAGVVPSVLSAAQTDVPALRRYVLGLMEAISLVSLPMSVGLALVAEDAVLLLLGPGWVGAVPALRMLALAAAFRSLTPIATQVLVVLRDVRWNMWTHIIGACVLPLTFWLGTRWGIAGVGAAWLIAYPMLMLPTLGRVSRRLGFRRRRYLQAIRPAGDGCIGMTAAVLLAGALLPATWHPSARLMTLVPVGVTTYLLVLLLLHRERMGLLVDFARRHLGRETAPDAAASHA